MTSREASRKSRQSRKSRNIVFRNSVFSTLFSRVIVSSGDEHCISCLIYYMKDGKSCDGMDGVM